MRQSELTAGCHLTELAEDLSEDSRAMIEIVLQQRCPIGGAQLLQHNILRSTPLLGPIRG
jgi:hypothetical protein